nr:hypothetical protein GCM10010200_081780 [Actinomadura rugatobispora]
MRVTSQSMRTDMTKLHPDKDTVDLTAKTALDDRELKPPVRLVQAKERQRHRLSRALLSGAGRYRVHRTKR